MLGLQHFPQDADRELGLQSGRYEPHPSIFSQRAAKVPALASWHFKLPGSEQSVV